MASAISFFRSHLISGLLGHVQLEKWFASVYKTCGPHNPTELFEKKLKKNLSSKISKTPDAIELNKHLIEYSKALKVLLQKL